MTALRHLLRSSPALSAWVIGCALLMKLLVPTGFMPVFADGTVRIAICGGTIGASAMTPSMAMTTGSDMHATHAGHAGMATADPAHPSDAPEHNTREMPCAFAGLSAAAIAATDAVLLAGAIAFVLGLGFAVVSVPRVTAPAFLRPPLRGPPSPTR